MLTSTATGLVHLEPIRTRQNAIRVVRLAAHPDVASQLGMDVSHDVREVAEEWLRQRKCHRRYGFSIVDEEGGVIGGAAIRCNSSSWNVAEVSYFLSPAQW